MATVKISQLAQLVGPPDSDDFIAIVDASLSETKKILISDLLSAVDSVANATLAIQATFADSALDARFAVVANRAFVADSVAVAANALTADAADSATNATNAILALRANSADSATNATFANYAQRAETADSATTAAFAFRADYLTLDSVGNATFALRSDSSARAASAIVTDFAAKAQQAYYDQRALDTIWDNVPVFVDSAIDHLKINLNAYSTDSAALWSVSPPTTVDSALDRLALVVRTLNGGTGA